MNENQASADDHGADAESVAAAPQPIAESIDAVAATDASDLDDDEVEQRAALLDAGLGPMSLALGLEFSTLDHPDFDAGMNRLIEAIATIDPNATAPEDELDDLPLDVCDQLEEMDPLDPGLHYRCQGLAVGMAILYNALGTPREFNVADMLAFVYRLAELREIGARLRRAS